MLNMTSVLIWSSHAAVQFWTVRNWSSCCLNCSAFSCLFYETDYCDTSGTFDCLGLTRVWQHITEMKLKVKQTHVSSWCKHVSTPQWSQVNTGKVIGCTENLVRATCRKSCKISSRWSDLTLKHNHHSSSCTQLTMVNYFKKKEPESSFKRNNWSMQSRKRKGRNELRHPV